MLPLEVCREKDNREATLRKSVEKRATGTGEEGTEQALVVLTSLLFENQYIHSLCGTGKTSVEGFTFD